MDKKKLRTRTLLTLIITILIWGHLIWEHYNGGVTTHQILHRADLPGISNWWGGLALPLLSWFLISRIQQRQTSEIGKTLNMSILRFALAIVFGITLSVFFSLGTQIPNYMMIGLIALSFFIPLYLSEYLLGFVIGMAYTFGAILPMAAGIILLIVSVISYKLIRRAIFFVISKAS